MSTNKEALGELAGERQELAAAPKADVQEPVAWRVSHPIHKWKTYDRYPSWADGDDELIVQPLYAAPQPAAQEPYAIECGFDNGDGTYSVRIKRMPLPSYEKPHKDWPVRLLYAAPAAPKAVGETT